MLAYDESVTSAKKKRKLDQMHGEFGDASWIDLKSQKSRCFGNDPWEQETQVKCMHRLPSACCCMNVQYIIWPLLARLPHVKGIRSAIGLTKTRLATER